MNTLRWICLCVALIAIGKSALGQSAVEPTEWQAVGGDAGNTRYSPLKQIDVGNVKNLGAAWTAKLGAAGTSSAVVVQQGRVFVTAGATVYALDARSGQVLWVYQPAANPSAKGVAVGDGRVYVGLANADLVALDEGTGRLLWTSKIGDADWRGVQLGQPPADTLRKPARVLSPQAGQRISAAPAYVDGKVIVGLANGDFGLRGRVACVDAATGRRLWQFFTVPGPGEAGHKSWPQGSDVWRTGGGGVWMNPAVDAELGLVYLGVGNPVPQWGGEIRPGDNLYTNSVVALDIRTGKLIWHFQAVHHDVWDHDLGTPLVLFDAVLRGRKRKGLAVMRTDGYLFELDRETGKALLPIAERAVPTVAGMKMSPTQPFPLGTDAVGPRCVEEQVVPTGFQRKCYFDPVGPDRNLMFPFSATRAAPMSFNPGIGYFYVTAGIEPLWVQRSDDPYYYGFFAAAPGTRNYGLLAAVDVHTGRIAWQKRMPYRIERGSGTTSTAGGLLLHGEPDGQLQAYDARDGALLWSFQTGAPVNGPIATYEVDGEQFVAVAAGELWTFKLGGTVPPRTAPTPPPTEARFQGPSVHSRVIEVGTTVFDVGTTGQHAMFDEYAFYPARTRVAQGTSVTWTNAGKLTHTIEARDGTWTTGPIPPGESRSVLMPRPGQYVFRCREHPWSTAELTVSDAVVNAQAQRGEVLYQANCAACHRDNLAGREPAPALAGRLFLSKWGGRPVGDLFELIRTSMPLGRPSSLSPQEYLDVVAFLLDTNDVRTGDLEVGPGASRLKEPIEHPAH